MKNKGRSLRTQIVLLVAVSIFTLVTVLTLYLKWFLDLTEKRATKYAHDNLLQVSEQLGSMFDNIQTLSFNLSFNQHLQEYLTTSNSQKKFIELYPMLAEMLEFIRLSNSDIYDVLIFDAEGTLLLSKQQAYTLTLADMIDPKADADHQLRTPSMRTVLLSNSVFFPYQQTIFGISAHTLMQEIGYCVVVCDGSSIQRLVSGISITEDAQLFVVDASGKVVAANIPDSIGTDFDADRYREIGGRDMKVRMDDGQRHLVQFAQVDDWTVFSIIPVASLMADFHQVIWLGLLIGACAIVFLLLVSGVIGNDINKSVERLLHFFQGITNTDAPKRIEAKGPSEIQQIQYGVNEMLDRLDETTDRLFSTQAELYQAQLLHRQAEYTALQRQINPHFLFNTLNCIATIGAVKRVPEIVTISSSMANIFRYCIKGSHMVSIADELTCVKDYLTIIHVRHHGKIESSIAVDEALQNYQIPKMILQPIVENAVFHGIEPKRGGGHVHISGQIINDEAIEMIVEDNGVGMDEETLAQLTSHLDSQLIAKEDDGTRSIGLINILGRIRIIFGVEAMITVESQKNQGSRVYLRLPVAPQ